MKRTAVVLAYASALRENSTNARAQAQFLNLGMYKAYAVCGAGAAAAAGSTFCGKTNIEGVHTFKAGVNYHFNTPIITAY